MRAALLHKVNWTAMPLSSPPRLPLPLPLPLPLHSTTQVLLMFGPEYARSCGIAALEPLGIFLPGDKNYPGGRVLEEKGEGRGHGISSVLASAPCRCGCLRLCGGSLRLPQMCGPFPLCVAAGGWLFDPLNLSGDAERYERMRVREVKNGRLAMVAFLGFAAQAAVTRQGPVENLLEGLQRLQG